MLLTANVGNNGDLIKRVSDFYIKNDDRVLDVTYGSGAFWRNTDTDRFDFRKSDLIDGVNFSNLPYENAFADHLVLDPPYMHGGATVKESINKCYRNQNTSHSSVIRLYVSGILEAARVLKIKGKLWVKCQDEIESGKQKFSSHELKSICEYLGFKTIDLFVLVQSVKPAMRLPYQKTARKNHSYLFIFEYKG